MDGHCILLERLADGGVLVTDERFSDPASPVSPTPHRWDATDGEIHAWLAERDYKRIGRAANDQLCGVYYQPMQPAYKARD